ncbi:Uncharacterised protein [Kingella potus]|uniref:Uncharacterized protein n=1 Tax=Kingella potus TaxID=265175 RepID=A0A377R194_9NEIS|nr:hypothetical protein [Kingella potus]UOP00297.1 hypothetical protein LVJ84_10355 [Kingella potus]STR02640.1 Uncharacterised protein [Kingella potus]
MKKHILLATCIAAITAAAPVTAADKPSSTLRILERHHIKTGGLCGLSVEKTFHYNGASYVLYSSEGDFSPEGRRSHKNCNTGSGTFAFNLAEIRNNRVTNGNLFSGTDINTRFLDVKSVQLNGAILTFKNNEFGKNPKTGDYDPNCCAADMYLNRFDLKTSRMLQRRFIGRDKSYD